LEGAGSCEMFLIIYHDFISWTTVIFIATALETSNLLFQKIAIATYSREWYCPKWTSKYYIKVET
jgi:hypothetical protein